MVDFVKLAATARRLIDANGRSVTVTQKGQTLADVAQPWRVDGSTTPRATVTGIAAFVDSGSLGQIFRNPDGTKRGTQVALFAATNSTDDLAEFDTILDGDRIWRIRNAEILQPGDTKILYMFEVER